MLAESVSMAMLMLLESLTPDERAVFVLCEVFGFDHHDIAAAVGKTVATVRQVAHRAHEHVQARRKRFAPVDAATTTRITEQFMTAAATGDMAGLLSLLAPDATWIADSGGKTTAARRPVVGAEKVTAFLIDLFHLRRARDPRVELVNCNNAPALVAYVGDRVEGVFLFEITNGRITNFYAVRNPDKLLAVTMPDGRRRDRRRRSSIHVGSAGVETGAVPDLSSALRRQARHRLPRLQVLGRPRERGRGRQGQGRVNLRGGQVRGRARLTWFHTVGHGRVE